MNRAAIYTRQSLDKTGDGLAVARQLTDGEKLCANRGWDIVARESDNDISGYSGKHRPGYQRILALAEARQIDVIVVWAVDRLTRRLADLVALIDLCERTGVTVATVAGDLDLSTDAGRLVARILGSVAQGEVERKSTRQQRAARQAAEAGKARKATPRPFGWFPDRITADPAEKAAVADACRALLSGGTVSGVTRDWQARGVRPRQSASGQWTRNSVTTILQNPRIAGIATYKGAEVGRGEWEPLVSEETFRAVAALLGDPARKRTAGVRTMLGGLAACQCGNHVASGVNHLDNHIYRCNPATRGDRPGPHVTIKSEPVDQFIGKLVIKLLAEKDVADLIAPKSREDVVALRDEATAIRSRLARLGPMFALGQITEQDMIAGRQQGDQRLEEIESRLAYLGRESALAPLIAADNIAAAWEKLTADRRRPIVDALMTVTLHPAGRGTREFNPRKVIHITRKGRTTDQ